MDVNDTCPRCAVLPAYCVRDSFSVWRDDTKRIQRWVCKKYGKKFSASTFKTIYRQRLRRINQTIRFGLAGKRCQQYITPLERLAPILSANVHAKTDAHTRDRTMIYKYFPHATQPMHISQRGCVVGQGEPKRAQFDSLFLVNNPFATVRAKNNRLNGCTWCTSKLPERLSDHVDIFIDVFCDRLKLLGVSARLHNKAEGLTVENM